MKLKNKVDKIKDKISKLSTQIKEIQDSCPHDAVDGKYKGDSGNWSSSDDSYWIDATCLECGKSLFVDSLRDVDLYRKLSLSGMIKH